MQGTRMASRRHNAKCTASCQHLPANRAINNKGNGKLFDRTLFAYDEKMDTFRCPAQQTLARRQLSRKDRWVM